MSLSARNQHRPGLGGLIRREWFLNKLDWGLRNLPSHDRRRIQRDLRRDVTATAAETGMRAAIADLGKSSELAHEYASGIDDAGPRYITGAKAAILTAGAILYLLMAYGMGTLDTLLAMGGGTRTTDAWGIQFHFFASENEFGVESSDVLPAFAVLLAISVVVFSLVSRIWRLGRSR